MTKIKVQERAITVLTIDAIKQNLIPAELNIKQINYVYANEVPF